MSLVHGHSFILKKLKTLSESSHLPPALLFHGPQGVGKKTVASYLIQMLLCENSNKPCQKCHSCLQLENETHSDVLWIQEKQTFIKIVTLASIRSFISLQSFSKKRIVVIDEAQKMNKQVQNSLLKLLEEPPKGVHFILVCDSSHKLLSTIRSRTQSFRFQKLNIEDLKKIYPNEDELTLKMCRGQAGRLEKWKNMEDTRSQVEIFWNHFLSGQLIPPTFLNLVRKRESALDVACLFQEILRDARFLKLNQEEQVIHLDQKKLLQNLSCKKASFIDHLFQKSVQLESDVKEGLDCVLCFENFYHKFYKEVSA